MKTFFVKFSFFISIPSILALSLQSPIPSQVPGLPMRNVHRINSQLYRGQGFNIPTPPRRRNSPESEEARALRYQEVLAFLAYQSQEANNAGQKFTDVLIFKDSTSPEILREKEKLSESGIQVQQIPFKWRNLESFQVACEQTIDALNLIKAVMSDPARMLYFHCTVGEDRTGLLSGIYILLTQRMSVEDVYRDELCLKGYEAGDPLKDASVAQTIRSSLSPVFFNLAYKIQLGQLSWESLDLAVCRNEGGLPPDPRYQWQNYRCSPSPLADPNFRR